MSASDSKTTCARRLLWGMVALLLVVNLPLFLCRHLTSDTVLYDLQARCALDGGVLYQDILEPNFPGVVWMHMLIRSGLGWSSVALRCVDLAIVLAIGWILGGWAAGQTFWGFSNSLKRPAVLLMVLLLYFSLTEWCHCQRDVWMLLPCLGATWMRRQTMQTPERARWGWGFFEGVLWGIAFWLKPHVGIPALFVLAASIWLTGWSRSVLLNLSGVLGGGLIAGALGSAWLIQTSAWGPFWQMQLEWNPEYLKAGRSRLTVPRLVSLWEGFAPWSWLHGVVLVMIGAAALDRISRSRQREFRSLPAGWTSSQWLLAALYLGWMAQIFLLQHPFAYVHLPGIVLALGLVATISLPEKFRRLGTWGALAFVCLAVMASPIFMGGQLASWKQCLTKGPTANVRSRIQLESQPDWKYLEPVLDYLRKQNPADGEVTAWTGGLVQLYPQLGLRAPTRYVYLDVLARLFRSRTDDIRQALEGCDQKFVVSSLSEAGMTDEAIADETDPDTLLPRCFPPDRLEEFPYNQPVVFRSGPYLVHRVSRPVGKLGTDYVPLAGAIPFRQLAARPAE